MRRLLLALALIFFINANLPANAGYFADKKAQIVAKRQLRSDVKAIRNMMKAQDKFADAYDFDGLSSLYTEDFKSSDGFDKEVYFKLIKETWASYPDISYTTNVKNIEVKDDKAVVGVYETSLATTSQIEDGVAIFGELHSYSNGTYYLTKKDGKWLINAETIQDEKSVLKYGDLRYVDLDLKSPNTVKAGEYYTASLTVDAPDDSVVIASICRDNISYPQQKADDIFKKLPEDKLLERMFLANKDGKNEYNVASVAMSKMSIVKGSPNLYIAGIAFIMTRVNVEALNEKEN